MKMVLVAAVALIDPDRRILVAQRPHGKAMAGLWEFPGGKVEPNELPEEALIRELREELGVRVFRSCLLPGPFASQSYTFEPPVAEPESCPVDPRHFIPAREMGLSEEFHLLMPLFLCRKWKGAPRAREGQMLAWRTLAQIRDLPMPPADLPLVAALQGMI